MPGITGSVAGTSAAANDGPSCLSSRFSDTVACGGFIGGGDMVATRLEGSGYRSGCAIAIVMLELAPQNEELSSEFEKVFARWRKALARQFVTWRITPGRATDLADLVMSVFEGALVVSRAARRINSFRTAIAFPSWRQSAGSSQPPSTDYRRGAWRFWLLPARQTRIAYAARSGVLSSSPYSARPGPLG